MVRRRYTVLPARIVTKTLTLPSIYYHTWNSCNFIIYLICAYQMHGYVFSHLTLRCVLMCYSDTRVWLPSVVDACFTQTFLINFSENRLFILMWKESSFLVHNHTWILWKFIFSFYLSNVNFWNSEKNVQNRMRFTGCFSCVLVFHVLIADFYVMFYVSCVPHREHSRCFFSLTQSCHRIRSLRLSVVVNAPRQLTC